ncbi:hypothetical protein VNI00_017648 [Paramarasmius palmivorus]|uniref:Uncharacterized protein n=1 Tax=Paramarasmius palmivorus TaxID=297713 RepID=A0AAW0B3W3_9AGAR
MHVQLRNQDPQLSEIGEDAGRGEDAGSSTVEFNSQPDLSSLGELPFQVTSRNGHSNSDTSTHSSSSRSPRRKKKRRKNNHPNQQSTSWVPDAPPGVQYQHATSVPAPQMPSTGSKRKDK